MNCPYCDNPLPPQTAQCPHCGAAVTPTSAPAGGQQGGTSTPQSKSPGLALFCSLMIAGCGQLYNGQTAKGVCIFFLCVFLWVVDLGFVVTILACIDAYRIAQKINSGRQVGPWEWF